MTPPLTLLEVLLNSEVRTGGHARYPDLMERLGGRGHRVVVALNTVLDYEPCAFEAVRTRVAYVRRGFPLLRCCSVTRLPGCCRPFAPAAPIRMRSSSLAKPTSPLPP